VEAFETSAISKSIINIILCSTASYKANICRIIYATPPPFIYGGIFLLLFLLLILDKLSLT
jgi:hypothetical protein